MKPILILLAIAICVWLITRGDSHDTTSGLTPDGANSAYSGGGNGDN